MSGGADTEDAAPWLAYYHSKKHDALFTIAFDALCIPLVEQMDDCIKKAKMSKARIKKLNRELSNSNNAYVTTLGDEYLCQLSCDSEYIHVSISFGVYNYYKDNHTPQMPEKLNNVQRLCFST
jgi:hypothetical protein